MSTLQIPPTIPAPWADDMVLTNRKPRLIYEAHKAMLVALNGYARDTQKLAPTGFKDAWRDILMMLAGGLEIEDSEMRLSYQFADTPDTDPVRALRDRIRATTQKKVLALLSHPATAQAVAWHVTACTKVMLDSRDLYIRENDGIRLAAATDDQKQATRRGGKQATDLKRSQIRRVV
jgi:hypothetical protein